LLPSLLLPVRPSHVPDSSPHLATRRATTRGARHWSRALALQLTLAVTAASSVLAQRVAGVGDDAIPIPRGGYRLQVSGLWNDYREVYTPDGKRPRLSALATDNFGLAFLPQLSNAQAGIRALTGSSNFALSLGPLEASGEVRQSIAPLAVDYGVSKRLSVRVLVPYVESRDVSQLVLNRNGLGANVGRNPALGTAGAASRATNGALIAQIEAARAALASEITRCASPTATGCTAIRANPAGAQTVVTRALSVRDALVSVYGNATSAGSPVVPISGSPTHTAVVATITNLRTDFGAYGISSIAETALPASATTVYGPAGIASVASDTFNVGYAELGNTRRAGIGDIDVTATYLLFDSFNGDQIKRLLTPTRGLRSNVTVGWRFGTAGADRTEDAFDVPIGEGAAALLVRSTTDVIFNERAWISATVRAVKPFGDRMAMRVPFVDESTTFASGTTVVSAARTLGNRLELELAPRLSFGQFFGVSAGYLVRHWGADRYDADSDGVAPAGGTQLDVASRTVSAAAFGVSFSTLSSYARGRSRFPAEVVYTHTRPLGASGGVVPVASTDRLELRVYTGFPRR
jgi:hypothetical protein